MATQQHISGLGHSNTPKLFKYVLSSSGYDPLTLTNVPTGWDKSELTFIRDPKYKGVLQEFSTNELRFVKEGRDYIQKIYEAKGIDHDITIRIFIQVNSTFEYAYYFVGKIDLSTYKIDATAVTAKISSTGFQDTVLNRENLKVDLLNTKYIGGGINSMEQLSNVPVALSLTEYQAIQNADWIVNTTTINNETNYLHHVRITVTGGDFPSGVVNSQTLESSPPFFISDGDRVLDLTGNVNGYVKSEDSSVQTLEMTIQLTKNNIVIAQWSSSTETDQLNFNESIAENVTVATGDELDLIATAGGTNIEIKYNGNTLSVSEDLTEDLPATNIDGWPIFEFTARILQLISGNADPLESDLLGRTDSQPRSYSEDGLRSLIIMSKGQWIREFPIEEGGTVIQTFNGSLADTFKTENGIANIGLGFELIDDDMKVRIEKEAYFFDISDNPNYPATDSRPYITNQILDLSDVVTDEIIEKEVLPDWYYNEIKSGYSKYEYEIVQGLKEFNTQSSYATPIKSVKNLLDLVSPFRSDTQGINKLRAKLYVDTSTEDVNGDNDVFFFDSKRLLEFTVKTDDDFDSVSGGVDPGQSYNLDYTPRRNFERHGNRVRSMRLAVTDEIQHMETDKNNKLVTQKTGESEPKAESGDILVNDLTPGYWIPEAYIFEAPVDEETIAAIQANPYGVIKIASDKWGWILEVQTNNENNKGQFKLLRVKIDEVNNVAPITAIKYGWIYNGHAVADPRNIAASGAHVPTKTELETLVTSLGGSSVAGGKLKEIGLDHWNTPNTGADNSSLFTGKGGGRRVTSFDQMKFISFIWSSTLNGAFPYYMDFRHDTAATFISFTFASTGFSVSLIKDSTTLSDGETGVYTGNDGKVYRTICIGTQEWIPYLAETKYRTGDPIPTETDQTTWNGLTTGAKCAYDNDEDNVLI